MSAINPWDEFDNLFKKPEDTTVTTVTTTTTTTNEKPVNDNDKQIPIKKFQLKDEEEEEVIPKKVLNKVIRSINFQIYI